MHYTKETQQTAIREYRQGKSVTEIARGIGASRSTVYNWIEKDGCAIQEKEVNLKLLRELQMRSERLKTMIEILKTVPFSAVNAPLREKLPTIENMAGEYSVNVLCEALSVPKGTYYNYLNRGKHGNTVHTSSFLLVSLNLHLQSLFLNSPFYEALCDVIKDV